MNFYNLGILEALIKLGASDWTPEEIRAHQTRLSARLKDVPWGDEPIPAHIRQSIRQQTLTPVSAEMKLYDPNFHKLSPSLTQPYRQVLNLGQTGVQGTDKTIAREALTPTARPSIPKIPPSGGAMARLKQLLRLAPKG